MVSGQWEKPPAVLRSLVTWSEDGGGGEGGVSLWPHPHPPPLPKAPHFRRLQQFHPLGEPSSLPLQAKGGGICNVEADSRCGLACLFLLCWEERLPNSHLTFLRNTKYGNNFLTHQGHDGGWGGRGGWGADLQCGFLTLPPLFGRQWKLLFKFKFFVAPLGLAKEQRKGTS